MLEYGEMSVEGVLESSNGFVVELGDFVVLGPTNGTNEEGAEERPGGSNVPLVGLSEPLATEPEATGSGGFGNANDSLGEKGRTDMGVATCRSVFALFR